MALGVLNGVYLLAIFATTQVSAYYCDSDRCLVDQYCCGVNICCTSYTVWQMWYFWCGLVLFVILLSACAGFCRYRYYEQAIIIGTSQPYSRLDNNSPHTQYGAPPVGVYTDRPTRTPQSPFYADSFPVYPGPRSTKYDDDMPPPSYAQAVIQKDDVYSHGH